MRLPATPVRVIAAPMAGGPSTPELVAAVGQAGGLGFLAAGYRSAADLAVQIGTVRQLSDRPFGVNLFVPAVPLSASEQETAAAEVARYIRELADDAARLRVGLSQPRWNDTDDWDAKIALLTEVAPVPLVSFTFGCPPAEVVDRLHRVGTAVAVTVTERHEAEDALAVGADALVVQGFEAGGHRSTHRVQDEPNAFDHLALLPMMTDLGVPLIAAGGITTAGDTWRALRAGADAVAAGTAFLLTHEAGTSPAHRMALTDPTLGSVITRAFSGRPARGLANRFVQEYGWCAPRVYPAVDQVTKPLRAAAARIGDLGTVSLWAGSGWRAANEEPAAAVVHRLAGMPQA